MIGRRHKLFQLSLITLIVIIIGIIRLSIKLPSYLQLSFRLEDPLLFLFIRLAKIVIGVIGRSFKLSSNPKLSFMLDHATLRSLGVDIGV